MGRAKMLFGQIHGLLLLLSAGAFYPGISISLPSPEFSRRCPTCAKVYFVYNLYIRKQEETRDVKEKV